MADRAETLGLLDKIRTLPPILDDRGKLNTPWSSFDLTAAPEVRLARLEQVTTHVVAFTLGVHAEIEQIFAGQQTHAYVRRELSATFIIDDDDRPTGGYSVASFQIQAGVATDERYLQLEATQQGDEEPECTVRTGPAGYAPSLVSWGSRMPLDIPRPVQAGETIYGNNEFADPDLGQAARRASNRVADITMQALRTYKETFVYTFPRLFAGL